MNFSVFLSVYGMLGKEAVFVLVNLGRIMEAKREEPISHVRACINVPISVTR